MTARASASDATAPVAIICSAMLPSAVASTGPGDHGAAGGVGGELVQQAVARSAADDPDLVEARAGQLLERFEHHAVLERQALEDRAGEGRRRRRAPADRSAGSTRRWPRPCRPGARTRGWSGSKSERKAWRSSAAAGDQRVVREILPGGRPRAPARLQQPQPADVLQQPRRAADAAFVGEIQLARPRRDDRRVELGAEQRPGARAEERGRRRRRTPTPRPTRCRGRPGRTTGVPASAAHTSRLQLADRSCPARRAAAAGASESRARSAARSPRCASARR